MEIEQNIKKLPKGLKSFVERSFDLIDLNEFYEDFRKKGGHLDGFHYHIELIRWFLKLEIVVPENKKQSLYEEYQNVKYVYQLPQNDIHQCLFYMNYLIGCLPQTGGHDFIKIYEKYKV
jgi:hypothetical protein